MPDADRKTDPVKTPTHDTPRRPGQPGAEGERREPAMPPDPPTKAPYPRDADGPEGR